MTAATRAGNSDGSIMVETMMRAMLAAAKDWKRETRIKRRYWLLEARVPDIATEVEMYGELPIASC